MNEEKETPKYIEVRGGNVHNLKNINVDIPLNKIVGIAGVSGSGKSSLALGILYAEGSRRYLESLSTYTRRRMTQAERANVDDVRYVPASLALRQRPGIPGIRSTFGTGTELLNVLRLMFSRLSSHCCPNGHYVEPSLNVALGLPLECPICKEIFYAPSAEELSFNSQGACKDCDGTGIVRIVDEKTLVPDESLSIDEGAVAPWQSLMWSLMKDIVRAMGVRTNVPFSSLTQEERDIVFHGPAIKKNIIYQNKTTGAMGDMDFTYFNATYTVENALAKVKDEKGMKRVEKFLRQEICPSCHCTRLNERARLPKIKGISLDEVCKMTLSEVVKWVEEVPSSLPIYMQPMAKNICESFQDIAKRLIELGLSYLTLDRSSSTLSTGERQRMQLARAVRNRTTGVLYVLDEPSIGLHPYNMAGLIGVMNDLIADGNSVILVDHDVNILSKADYLIELGPDAGKNGGNIIAIGTIDEIINNSSSKIGKFLSLKENIINKNKIFENEMFINGNIHLETSNIHTVKPLKIDFPKGRLITITGVSGSGKTTMILESLVPALESLIKNEQLPQHIKKINANNINQVKLIDSSPIGINVRSTVATYIEVHDELRKVFAKTTDAKNKQYKEGDFSYNTGKLRCPTCDGTGTISLDVQFLPDVEITCPDCNGSRYAKDANLIKRQFTKVNKSYSLPELMDMSIEELLPICQDLPNVYRKLQVLNDLGLSYLTLGEETPSLSGGEAQRLKLASEMGKGQSNTIFIFDEPTIGLHPLDVKVLLNVFKQLINQKATVIVIEHDLDVIYNSDYVIDMGPGGGEEGGKIIFKGTPEQLCKCNNSYTGKFLNDYIKSHN